MTASIMFSMVKTRLNIACCHLCSQSFCKISRPPTYRGCENDLAIPEKLKKIRNKLWRPEQATDGRILWFWLGGRQRKSEVNLQFYLHAQRWSGKLMLKKTTNSCPFINQGRAHCLDTGRKESHLTITPTHKAQPSATRPTTRSNQGFGEKHLRASHPIRPGHCAYGGEQVRSQ